MYFSPLSLTIEDREIWYRVSAAPEGTPNRAFWHASLRQNSQSRDIEDSSVMVVASQGDARLNGCWLVATQIVGGELLDEEDRDVAGRYWVEFERPVPLRMAATVALDEFHRQVPIRWPEDFELLMMTDYGKPLVESGETGSYESNTRAFVERRTTD